MTDRIDIDDLDVPTDEEEDDTNHGDWFWRGEGSPDDDPGPADHGADLGTSEDAAPRVPHENDDRPAGVPVESGGAGGGIESESAGTGTTPTTETGSDATPGVPDAGGNPAEGGSTPGSAAHGGDAASDPDDMTQAFTYQALKSLEDVPSALAETEAWADWLGVVGHVDAHVLNKFQRDNRIDLDFFNGSGTGPAERLAAIGDRSMFYADRMVLIGTEGEEEIAEEAGWEFVPITEAAEKAGWELA